MMRLADGWPKCPFVSVSRFHSRWSQRRRLWCNNYSWPMQVQRLVMVEGWFSFCYMFKSESSQWKRYWLFFTRQGVLYKTRPSSQAIMYFHAKNQRCSFLYIRNKYYDLVSQLLCSYLRTIILSYYKHFCRCKELRKYLFRFIMFAFHSPRVASVLLLKSFWPCSEAEILLSPWPLKSYLH